MKEHRQSLEQQREMISVKSEYLKQLKENEVDLTRYLIALAMRDIPRNKTDKKKTTDGENKEEEEANLLNADFLSTSF